MFSSNLKKSAFFNRFLIWLISIVSLIVAAVVARWVFHEAGYGFDFQDESFALLSAEFPGEYRLLPTRIGYFLKPLYMFVGRDIPLLRQFSYLLLVVGLYLNFYYALRKNNTGMPGTERACLFSTALILGAYSWIARGGTCRSLGYNQQTAIILLLLSASVLCWMSSRPDRIDKFSWSHFCAGLLVTWLSFIKPSAAIVLLPMAGLVLMFLGYFRGRQNLLGLSTGSLLLLLPYFLFVESPLSLLESLREWQAQEAILQSGHGLRESTLFAFQETMGVFNESFIFFGKRFFACMAVLALILWRIGICLGQTFAAVALMVLLPIAATYGNLDAFSATFSHSFSGSFALALSLLVAAILHGVFFGRGKKHLFWKEPIFVWCLFMALSVPFLYSYGTNIEYQSRAGGAATLYLGSSVLLVFFSIRFSDLGRHLLPMVASCLFAFFLMPKWQSPSTGPGPEEFAEARSGSVWFPRQKCIDMKEFKSFMVSAKAQGWKPGTEMLDFWGRFPGITYLMGGKSPRWPWYMSIYSGATPFTHLNLEEMGHESRENLWLMEACPAEPHIKIVGAPLPIGEFPNGYQKVGRFQFQASPSSPAYFVRLWKPEKRAIP